MRTRAFFLLVAGFWFCACPVWASPAGPEIKDTDGDGRPDNWTVKDAAGKRRFHIRDSNADGRPDVVREFLRGREMVLKSSDRNFDGRVDRRAMLQWDAARRMPYFDGKLLRHLSIPGYVTLWSEEDNDYDGKVDVYRERGNASPPKDRIGQPIDSGELQLIDQKTTGEAAEPPGKKKVSESPAERRIERLNTQYGLDN